MNKRGPIIMDDGLRRKKVCANCGNSMDRQSKKCRVCYLKAVEKDPEAWRAHRNEYQRRWKEANLERWHKIARDGQRRYREKNRGIYREARRYHRWEIRREVLELLGGVQCVQCGFSDWRALQVDHINGDGYIERRNGNNLIGGGLLKFRSLIKTDLDLARQKYQVLCANCNKIKQYENKEWANCAKA